MDFEKFFMITNPLFWLFYLLSWLGTVILWFWDKVLWNRKRFYWHLIDYYFVKKKIKRGLNEQGVRNARAWLRYEERRKIKHHYLKEIKSLIDEAENKFKNEVEKRPTEEGE